MGRDEVLIAVKGSSVNPVNVDLVEQGMCGQAPFYCTNGTMGSDAAGVVVALGESAACSHLKVGSEVWTNADGAYATYATAPCSATGLKPSLLSFVDAGTIPCVGVTALECLQATGAFSAPIKHNLTVAVTSGQGGTGFMGIQLSKALGAARVVTAASGTGISFVKALGADVIVDFKKQDMFDALPDDSVDVVFDNFGKPGTADKAMHAIRAGGVFLVLEGGLSGKISKHPKPGVRQIAFGLADGSDHTKGLDVLRKLWEDGKLKSHTQQAFGLSQVADAFTMDKNGLVIGKLAIDPTK